MTKKLKMNLLKQTGVCITVLLITSCANFAGNAQKAAKNDKEIFETPLREPKKLDDSNLSTIASQNSLEKGFIKVKATPAMSVKEEAKQAEQIAIAGLGDTQISRLSFNNMPVSVFINEVFGNQLNLNFVINPSVKKAQDLVTMRLTNTVSQIELYQLAAKTLTAYGVTTSNKENVLIFDFSENATDGAVPLLVSGQALPEVPSSNRPIFLIYQLTAVKTPLVRGWLTQMFPRNQLEVIEDPVRNAIIFKGSHRLIEQALAATKLLDKPTMQGMFSKIIKPNFSDIKELSNNLEKVLKAEGYSVRQSDGSAAIRLLPLESAGQLVVFAKSQDVLEHVVEWAKNIESEQQSSIEYGLFSYQVQSTQAEHIVQVLNTLGVGSYSGSTENSGNLGGNNVSRPLNRGSSTSSGESQGRYAVDEQLNTILYSGSGKSWLQILPVLQKLDKPAPSVMVEVILAEVSLDDSETTGIDWLAKAGLGKYSFDLNFTKGLNFALDGAGETKAILNFLYSNNKANIKSRPRLMVKSGETASIDVGNRIPTISSTIQSTDSGNAPTVQNIVYQETGVILSIKPTVHASGFVDIEIDQTLSQIGSGDADNLQPTIFNRAINTTVTLRDGGSVLIGGLISSNSSATDSGTPVLGKIPVLGKLFSDNNETLERRELMIMIIPYVLNSPYEAEQLTDELQRKRMEDFTNDF